MTRDEEIIQASDEWAYQIPPQYSELVCNTHKTMCAYQIGFIDGAVWADAHPHWISVEDELPKESGGFYLSVDSDGEIWFRQFTKLYGWRSTIGNMLISGIEVTHWMPLPEPPKKGGEE